MTPAVDGREYSRRGSPGLSRSPARHHHSPRRRERSPNRRMGSPRARTPKGTNRPKTLDRDTSRSPKHMHSRSPSKNKTFADSPSPRTKRLSRARGERESEKVPVRDHGRDTIEERERSRHRGRGEVRDAPSERSVRDKNSVGGVQRTSRHERSVSPEERRHKSSRYSSRSPPRASKDGARHEETRPRSAENLGDGDDNSVAKMKAAEEALEAKDKQKPSFELSGKLAEETNRVRGITLLFNEPADARKPDIRWRLYVFKAGEVLNEPLYVHRQSCYLFGRERRVADIPTDHPSCSKQHAVIQYRLVDIEQPDGLMSKQVRPYVMDLGSTNGTFVNDNRIEAQRYYELFEKDTIRFGNSSREYVLLHENSSQ